MGQKRTRLPLALALLATASIVATTLEPASAGAVARTPGPSAAAPVPSHHAPTSALRRAGGVVAPIPVLHWHACQWDASLECTRATVPLDYDHPNGATTRLFMVKRPASPLPGQQTIGTLFVNPGGPGGPSSEVADIFARLLGKPVQRHFDVIGIDPRGVGGSTPVRCRIPGPTPAFPEHAFPMTPTEVRTHIRFNRYERKACRQGGSTILDHMTTADTARDMDLIRQAVGEDQLSYYGISYGTYLGATYARLFPHQVRALIVDGVLDPVAWSTGRNGSGTVIPFSTRLGSGRGAADAMLSALALCDQVGQERCAFAGNARHKWRQLTNRLRKEPLEFPDGSTLAYADLIDGVLGGLYSSSDYRFLMRDLQRLWTRTNPPTKAVVADDEIRAVRDRLVQRERRLPYGYGLPFFPSFEGVACSDTLNPSDPAAWQRAADRSEATQPWFGRLWTWVSAACPNWPGSAADAFRGPWHGTTANPVLLVGNAHDPATPFSGAAALHQLLDGSRLFRLDGWGHGALGESRCVTKVFDAYLVQGTLPAVGTVCEPDDLLFPVRHST